VHSICCLSSKFKEKNKLNIFELPMFLLSKGFIVNVNWENFFEFSYFFTFLTFQEMQQSLKLQKPILIK